MAEGLSQSGELRGSSEEAVCGALGSGGSHSSVLLLQPETFAELGSVRPPGEAKLGGHIPEPRRGIFPSHVSCFRLKQLLFHQLHLGLFSLCACVSEQSRSVLLQQELRHHRRPSLPPGLGLAGGAGSPRTATDLLGCPEPLGLGLSRVNASRRDVLCQERPSSAWLLWEFSG